MPGATEYKRGRDSWAVSAFLFDWCESYKPAADWSSPWWRLMGQYNRQQHLPVFVKGANADPQQRFTDRGYCCPHSQKDRFPPQIRSVCSLVKGSRVAWRSGSPERCQDSAAGLTAALCASRRGSSVHADSGATGHRCHADYTEVQPAIQRYSIFSTFQANAVRIPAENCCFWHTENFRTSMMLFSSRLAACVAGPAAQWEPGSSETLRSEMKPGQDNSAFWLCVECDCASPLGPCIVKECPSNQISFYMHSGAANVVPGKICIHNTL